ncbi:hypothetical protein RIF29_19805 [Crotalaria pallida]|uniref:Uncharacterized protein n=1 Tax=Crotalaria pallida TaxID=3830 RepID=A0AAN9F1C9_CROPI
MLFLLWANFFREQFISQPLAYYLSLNFWQSSNRTFHICRLHLPSGGRARKTLTRVSAGSSTKIVGVSLRKSFTGRVLQRKSDVQLDASKKDSRAYLDHQKNDTNGGQSVVITNDRFARKPLLASRMFIGTSKRMELAQVIVSSIANFPANFSTYK